jgi:hypothetical protein
MQLAHMRLSVCILHLRSPFKCSHLLLRMLCLKAHVLRSQLRWPLWRASRRFGTRTLSDHLSFSVAAAAAADGDRLAFTYVPID